MPVTHRPRAPSISSSSETETETTAPTATDADDSIVLSDLVRTGEASRLRRRGAMRLEHGLMGLQNHQRASSPTTVIVVGSPGWQSEPDDHDVAGPVLVRNDRERGSRYGRGHRETRRNGEDGGEDFRFTLFCGGESSDPESDVDHHRSPYEPSVLPLYPSTSTSASVSSSSARMRRRRSRRSNGCGTLLHTRAAPRQGMWTARSEASDAVVGMDSMYFDRSVVANMVRIACGCVREGVGCAVCGNPLGTRYKQCKSAEDGVFPSRPRPSPPVQSDGSRQWYTHAHPPSRPSNSNTYVYTFLSTAVTSYPPYTSPQRSPSQSWYAPPQTILLQPPSQPQPQTPPAARQSEETNGNAGTPSALLFDRVLTASPANLEETNVENREPYQRAYPVGDNPASLQVPSPGLNANVSRRGFDPDGELIAAETEPSSPDKTNDVFLIPGR